MPAEAGISQSWTSKLKRNYSPKFIAPVSITSIVKFYFAVVGCFHPTTLKYKGLKPNNFLSVQVSDTTKLNSNSSARPQKS